MVYRKNPTDQTELRQMAKTRMSQWAELDAPKADRAQVQHLLEELQIHQIELEMQNEHLNAARDQLEQALSQCNDLYDFSPFGSVMIDAEGVIIKLNLLGAKLLGRERVRLLGSRLGYYIAQEQRHEFNAMLVRAKSVNEAQTGDLRLDIEGDESRQVQIRVVWIGVTTGWQVALVDTSERYRLEAQLRASEKNLALALSAVGDGAWDWQVSSGEVMLSDEFIELFGYSREELGHHVTDLMRLVHPDDKPPLMQKLQHCITGKINHYANEHRMQCKDGSWKWVLGRGLVVGQEKNGQVLRVVGTLVDISPRKEIETRLATLAQFQHAVFDSVSAQIAVLDESGTILQTNMAWQNYAASLGYMNSVGQNYLAMLPGLVSKNQHVGHLVALGMAAVAASDVPYFYAPEPVQCPCGKCWFTIKITPVRDAAQRMVVTHEDVTELKRAQLATLALANMDSLTGAASRQHFMSLAEQELSRSLRYQLPLVVLMLDLDHFKDVNDTYGHQGGDAVLMGFVQTVQKVLRESDVIGRIGGEEFAVLLPNTTQEGGLALAQRILAEVRSNRVEFDGKSIACTVSIGVGCLSGLMTFSALLADCDAALYRAKNSGRDRLEVSWQKPADTAETAVPVLLEPSTSAAA